MSFLDKKTWTWQNQSTNRSNTKFSVFVQRISCFTSRKKLPRKGQPSIFWNISQCKKVLRPMQIYIRLDLWGCTCWSILCHVTLWYGWCYEFSDCSPWVNQHPMLSPATDVCTMGFHTCLSRNMKSSKQWYRFSWQFSVFGGYNFNRLYPLLSVCYVTIRVGILGYLLTSLCKIKRIETNAHIYAHMFVTLSKSYMNCKNKQELDCNLDCLQN